MFLGILYVSYEFVSACNVLSLRTETGLLGGFKGYVDWFKPNQAADVSLSSSTHPPFADIHLLANMLSSV